MRGGGARAPAATRRGSASLSTAAYLCRRLARCLCLHQSEARKLQQLLRAPLQQFYIHLQAGSAELSLARRLALHRSCPTALLQVLGSSVPSLALLYVCRAAPGRYETRTENESDLLPLLHSFTCAIWYLGGSFTANVTAELLAAGRQKCLKDFRCC